MPTFTWGLCGTEAGLRAFPSALLCLSLPVGVVRPEGLALPRRRPCRPSPGDQLCAPTARSSSAIPGASSRHRSQHGGDVERSAGGRVGRGRARRPGQQGGLGGPAVSPRKEERRPSESCCITSFYGNALKVCKCQHVNSLSLSDIIASFQKCVSCIFSSTLQACSVSKFL